MIACVFHSLDCKQLFFKWSAFVTSFYIPILILKIFFFQTHHILIQNYDNHKGISRFESSVLFFRYSVFKEFGLLFFFTRIPLSPLTLLFGKSITPLGNILFPYLRPFASFISSFKFIAFFLPSYYCFAYKKLSVKKIFLLWDQSMYLPFIIYRTNS